MSPKIRQSYYYLTSIVSGVIGLALLYGGISAGLADNVTEVLAGIGGMLGATGPALAGRKVGEQAKDGTFDSIDPATKVLQGVREVRELQAAYRAQSEAIKTAVSEVVDDLPIVGPIAAEVLAKSF